MKIRTGLAILATVIAIILIAQWRVTAEQTKVKGIPKAPGAPVTFKANEGDLAAYEGHGSATEESESGPRSAKYDFKRTQFILGASYSDSTTAAVLTEVTFSKETRRNDTFLAPVATGVAIDRMPMTDPTSAGEQPEPAFPDLPNWGVPDRSSLKLGDEWTTEEPTPNNTSLLIPLKCKVAAREEVGGRMCLRVDVEPTETVPFKLTKTPVVDGMRPAPAMLTEFQETIWIGESDGWLVKRTHAIKLEPTEVTSSGPRMHKSSLEDSIQLVDRQALAGKALTERIDQIAKLRYIQAYTHNQQGWCELLNVGEASKIADEKIAAFEKEYPKSPYMAAVEVEKRNVEINRRNLATNAKWFAKRSDKLGQLAANLTGKTIDGKPFELKDLRGHPALLYFLDYGHRDLTDRLAPDLDSFARTWSKKGLKTIGIAQRTAESYEKRNKPSFTLFQPDPQARTTWDNNVNYHYSMAVVVILDKDGYIRYYRCGFFPEELSSVLAKML